MRQYTLNSADNQIVIRNSLTGTLVRRIPSDTTITARTNSHDVISECCEVFGPVVSVYHDGDTIHVTTD